MTVETQKYIRKPLYVDAVRITVANFEEIANWCQGEIQKEETLGEPLKKFIKVRVHNPKHPRQTQAFVGDWILYTERGYKVYTNKAFHASFDLAQTQSVNGEENTGKIRIIDATPEEIANAVLQNSNVQQALGTKAKEEVD